MPEETSRQRKPAFTGAIALVLMALLVALIANIHTLQQTRYRGFVHPNQRLSQAADHWVVKSFLLEPHLVDAFVHLWNTHYDGRSLTLPADLIRADIAQRLRVKRIEIQNETMTIEEDRFHRRDLDAFLWYNPFVFSPIRYRITQARTIEPPITQRYPLTLYFMKPETGDESDITAVWGGPNLYLIPSHHLQRLRDPYE